MRAVTPAAYAGLVPSPARGRPASTLPVRLGGHHRDRAAWQSHRAVPGRQQAGAPACPAHPDQFRWPGNPARSELGKTLLPSYIVGREQELIGLIFQSGDPHVADAACRGVHPDTYHPEVGEPDPVALRRCAGCPSRLSCLALALRAEDPEIRSGWYGGLGPTERDGLARRLRLTATRPTADQANQARRLRAAGLTVDQVAERLGCSRRTVQRYTRTVA